MPKVEPKPRTERVRQRFESSHVIQALPARIFPLLCPVREYEWIPGWDCRLIYTESGLAEPGAIFQTDREADDGLDTWVISRYEPGRLISFVRVNHLRTIHYEIRLDQINENSTKLVWSQEITALSPAGDHHVGQLKESDFARGIDKVGELLRNFLGNGSSNE